MPTGPAPPRMPLAEDVTRWTLLASLDGASETEAFEGACEQLIAGGIPLLRAALAGDMLDPTFDSQGVRWTRGQSAVHETFLRSDDATSSLEWRLSPFRRLTENPESSRLRRRLDASYVPGEFPILDTLRGRGATDYVAMILRLGTRTAVPYETWMGSARGVVSSWATDHPDGFSDAQVDILSATLPVITTTFLLQSMQRSTRSLLATYLGQDAATRVLEGNVVRGKAQSIRTVVWYSDLVGFTSIADAEGADVVLALLNDYAEVQVDAIEKHGGHVLKFIGDGLLAIFPADDESASCKRALDATAEQRRQMDDLNARRQAAGLRTTLAHVALHLGEVLYGNVGSARRLDFTVLGPAVNEAARIEALCGSLDQRVVVSSAFRQACGSAQSRLVSLGRYAMKGVARPQELYTLDPDVADGS